MRPTREILFDLSVVNDEIEATHDLMNSKIPVPCYASWDFADRDAYQRIINSLECKRRKLEDELVRARKIDEQRPSLFAEARP